MSSAGNGEEKIKVAIIGGGCAAMTAAFELTRPEQEQRYAVTVYQMGWRLGGKGASGRDREKSNRTEEHGLHVWMGFYENAFRLIRECYGELSTYYEENPDLGRQASRFAEWDEAFFPDHWVGVADESRGAWRIWSSFFPATPGLPGDALDPDNNPFTLSNYLARACDLLRALIHSTFYAGSGGTDRTASEPLEDLSTVSPEAIIEKLTSVVRTGVLTGVTALYEAMGVLQVVLRDTFPTPNGDYTVLKYAQAIAKSVRKQTDCLLATDEQLRPKLDLIDLVVAVVVGILRDGLLSDPDGLDAIDDEDCKVWLKRHGASERAVESPLVRALYDMAFANVEGAGGDKPGLAAGQALRGALRMFFTYRGSLFWKMRAGMGDVVFSPLYEVLKNRGVAFEFFHELTDIHVGQGSDGSKRVTELHFRVQTLLDPDWRKNRLENEKIPALERKALDSNEYYPLDPDGCWPSTPNLLQLIAGSANTPFESPSSPDQRGSPLVLKESDFDCVVLGIGLGAIPLACGKLLEADEQWRAMVTNVKTVATQALQLWLRDGLEELAPSTNPTTVSGFVGAFDTWSDMTHVIAEEGWKRTIPKGLLYLCGALSHEDEDKRVAGGVVRAIDYLDYQLPLALPNLRNPQTREFRWEQLVDPAAPAVADGQRLTFDEKANSLRGQYFSLNTNPSDRYVLTRPGSTRYRISPLDPTYENLTIAGDWTNCGFNEGCVEAAVMSGLLAAHSISYSPTLEDIVGYDHP